MTTMSVLSQLEYICAARNCRLAALIELNFHDARLRGDLVHHRVPRDLGFSNAEVGSLPAANEKAAAVSRRSLFVFWLGMAAKT